MPIRIVITGGHLTPAIATIQALQKKPTQILFVGRKYTSRDSLSHEQPQIESLGVDFTSIYATKFHRKPLLLNLAELTNLPSSLVASSQILKSFKPHLVLSFGGYLALPVVVGAKNLGIPIITHEQTTRFGLSNQIISPLCTKVAHSWPSTYTKSKKNTLTGNPIRSQFTTKQPKPAWFKTNSSLPTIYITGGNQGARAINQLITQTLHSLTQHYTLLHQTGSARNNQDFNQAAKAKSSLNKSLQNHYYPRQWLSASEVAWCLEHADLVISRSGANTITELLVTSTRSILIPLPVSGGNEQFTNAQLLASLGLAYLLPQTHLHSLPIIIQHQLSLKPTKLSRHLNRLTKLHLGAAQKLASLSIKCAKQDSD